MRDINTVNLKHAQMAREYIATLDKKLNVYVNVFDDICVTGIKDGRYVYREFKPWS